MALVNLKQIQVGGSNTLDGIATYPSDLVETLDPFRLWVNNNEADPAIFVKGSLGNIVRIGGSGKTESYWKLITEEETTEEGEVNTYKYLYTNLPVKIENELEVGGMSVNKLLKCIEYKEDEEGNVTAVGFKTNLYSRGGVGSLKINGDDEEGGGSTDLYTFGDLLNVNKSVDTVYNTDQLVIKKANSTHFDVVSLSDLNLGLNETELQAYLTNNKYTTESRVTTMINSAMSGFATADALNTHVNNTTIHLTADEKTFVQTFKSLFGFDTTNNAVYVKKVDGVAVNFYAFGGVGSLGEAGSGGGGGGTGTVTSIKLGTVQYDPNSSGVISLPAYPSVPSWALASTKPTYYYTEIIGTPTSLPASDVYAWAKQPYKPSYSYGEISGAPTSLPASDVYSWAKQPTKPTYTFTELLSKPTTVSGYGITDAVTLYTTQTNITGQKTFRSRVIVDEGASSNAGVSFYNDGTYRGAVGHSPSNQMTYMWNANSSAYIAITNLGTPIYINTSGTVYNLLHAGNYTSYSYSQAQADARFVYKSGDTMTGRLYVTGVSINTTGNSWALAISGATYLNGATGIAVAPVGVYDLTLGVQGMYSNGPIRCAGLIYSSSRIYTGYDSGVSNSVSAANWFRSSASTGWINDTYGGGIYMTNSTYVAVYNNKAFRVYNTLSPTSSTSDASIRTDGGILAGGNILAVGGLGSLTDASDMRLKTHIRDYNALEIINTFESFAFDWNDTGLSWNKHFNNDHDNYGLSAQQVLKFNPNFVDTYEFHTVKYKMFIPILLKGEQELYKLYESHEDRITRLERENKELRSEINNLKGVAA